MPTGGNDGKANKVEGFVKPPQSAIRTFGAAPHICPGRHFATTEILCMDTLMLMRYDIQPVGDKLSIPGVVESIFSAISPPKEDIEVIIKDRDGWHGKWGFELGDPKLKFPLASG